MKRRRFIHAMGLGSAGLAVQGCAGLSRKKAKRDAPNIVLIMADDMGYSDIGCYGGEIHTPNLDRLAQGGVRFTQFYNTARCCPTRASLMTGLYPHQAGVGHMMNDRKHPGYQGDLNGRCVTIAEVLKGAGYATAMSGKWHVTKQVGHWSGNEKLVSKHNWPLQRGYDRFFGTIHGAGSFYDPISLTRGNTPIEPETDAFFYTDAISDNAVRFFDDFRNDKRNKPFFCYVAYTSPHWPLHALPEDIAKYEGRYDRGWDALREERRQRMIEMGLIDPRWELTERDPRVKAWNDVEDKEWQAKRMEVYAAQIDRMDQGIGRIVEALRNNGQLDNTLILFLADNGGCAEELSSKWGGLHIPKKTRDGQPVRVGNEDHEIMPGPEETYQSYGIPWANASNTPFRRYKHWVHEGGISTPLIAHWPASVRSRDEWCGHPGHLIDIMATCVDVSGALYPSKYKGYDIQPMEGCSLVPAFQGRSIERHNPIYFEHEGNRAIRDGQWKLVAKGKKGAWELYDMEADRTETNDLANQYPERAGRLAAEWKAWAERANVLPWPQE